MKVITKEPGKAPEIRELPREEMRDFIGGCMETVPFRNYLIVCNDSFMLNDMQYNITLGDGDGTMFCGNIFICKIEELPSHERDFGGLDDYEAQLILDSVTRVYEFEKVLHELQTQGFCVHSS